MSDTLTYTDYARDLYKSTSLQYVVWNENEGFLAISYRTSPNKWYVYNVTDDELEVFKRGIKHATSAGRYVNDWTLGRQSDRTVESSASLVRMVAVLPKSERKTNVATWRAVFAVGDAELTLSTTVSDNVDAEAHLRKEASTLVTKGEPRLRELTRTFE